MAGLDIVLSKNSLGGNIKQESLWLNQWIESDEWEELFQNVLHAPIDIEQIEGEPYLEFEDRQKRLFQEDLTGKGYEMLGRIWDILSDAFFAPSEVDKLLKECLEIQQKTENKNALSALEKLIFACHEALKVKSGIFLACD